MGWTRETAKALDALMKEKGISYRDLDGLRGHTYNYWWQRIGKDDGPTLSLEDIEAICERLNEDPRSLITKARPK
ncbi:MAG: hypothetical protein CVT65_03620 [Actinobacteria bacterium HGW-Actinobacteria-5]|jgi:DNA-binding Xre family transcriptional regulator|nr:MAG: hypothetical protein CVT65_03620 [Actinobacteria bacterium HGW-Actinobacteria-5]